MQFNGTIYPWVASSSTSGGGDDDQEMKDDSSPQTTAAYYALLACFFSLACLGFVNVYLAFKIRKMSKPIVTFYLTSETVVIFRILLFSDPFVKWSSLNYGVLLISMPSYMYLVVGLSQVMLTLESIIKYKNFKIREEEAISNCALKEKWAKN